MPFLLNRVLNAVRHSSARCVSSTSVLFRYQPVEGQLENDDRYERSLNLVQLIGRVGCDPRVTGQRSETRVVIFSLATNEYFGNGPTNNNNNKPPALDEQQSLNETDQSKSAVQQRVDWHRITVFRPYLKQQIEKYLRQGDRVYVKGRIHYDLVSAAEKTDAARYVTSVIADELIFLGRPRSSAQ